MPDGEMLPQLGARLFVLASAFGLTLELAQARRDLRHDVTHSDEIIFRLLQAVERLPTLLLVAGDARSFLEENTAVFGAQSQGLVDHPLPDDGRRASPQSRPIE